jgi:hypothetical protein
VLVVPPPEVVVVLPWVVVVPPLDVVDVVPDDVHTHCVQEPAQADVPFGAEASQSSPAPGSSWPSPQVESVAVNVTGGLPCARSVPFIAVHVVASIVPLKRARLPPAQSLSREMIRVVPSFAMILVLSDRHPLIVMPPSDVNSTTPGVTDVSTGSAEPSDTRKRPSGHGSSVCCATAIAGRRSAATTRLRVVACIRPV